MDKTRTPALDRAESFYALLYQEPQDVLQVGGGPKKDAYVATCLVTFRNLSYAVTLLPTIVDRGERAAVYGRGIPQCPVLDRSFSNGE
jgi:hypothetical protein